VQFFPSSVKLVPHHASPLLASAVLLIAAINPSSCHSGADSLTPLQLDLSFGFGFMFVLVMLFFWNSFVRFFTTICRFVSLTDPSRLILVLSFHWHPFGCLVRCLLGRYHWVSMSFALETAFSGPTREAWIIFDPLPTICMYFLHCNFIWVCCWGSHPFFGILILVPVPDLLRKKKSTPLNKKRLLWCVGSVDLWEKLHLTTRTHIGIVCERVLG
jgi:hypothetical protein